MARGVFTLVLEALCREAGMRCLRRLMPEIDFAAAQIPYSVLMQLEVQMRDFTEALREVEPSAIREVFVEVPDVGWEDVGGLAEIKRRLIEAVEWPLKHAEFFAEAGVKPPKGILLSGPPGSGKTLLAKAVANESEVNFLSVKGPALLSKYVGESERGVREVFRKAKQAAPCIVFFDEMDALVPVRGSGSTDSHVTERVISQFLTELDGIEELSGVLILGATNRLDLLDAALLRPGRFDLILEISLPEAAERREIFRIGLKAKPVAKDLGADGEVEECKLLDGLVAATDGFSGAEIQGIADLAALDAIREAIEVFADREAQREPGGTRPKVLIKPSHLQQALERLRVQRGAT